MSVYIKTIGNDVILAGTVINERMLADGYFEYFGDIPTITSGESLSLINGVLTISTKAIEIPEVITTRQARLILLQYALLDEIELMIASDKALQIWWEYSLEYRRDNELLISVATQLGLTGEQIDQMFIAASKL